MTVSRTAARRRARNRRGTSHVLTIIVQIPLLVLIIATVIEISSILLTQIGLRYSAASAARAAIVWLPAEGTVEERLERIRLATNSSFAPFASGRDVHIEAIPLDEDVDQVAEAFHSTLTAFDEHDTNSNLLRNKMKYARGAMKIEIDVYDDFDPLERSKKLRSKSGHVVVNYVGRQEGHAIDQDNPDIDVVVSFEKPIDLPGVGAFLGGNASWPNARFYSRVFRANCSLTIEGVKSTNHHLGVKYDVFKN